MTEVASRKSMTEGELGVILAFSALTILALVGAAKAQDTAFAFHAYLTAAASVAVVFGTFNHYFDRPADAAGEGNRRSAQLQLRTDQGRRDLRDVLGHRRISGRPVGRAGTRVAGAQLRPAVVQFRPHPPAAHLGGDLRVRRQRADRDVLLCRAEDLPGAARRRARALVRRAGLQLLHPDRRAPAICSASPSRRNMPSRNGTPTCG